MSKGRRRDTIVRTERTAGIVLVCLVYLCVLQSPSAEALGRPWTTEDSIAVRYYGTHHGVWGGNNLHHPPIVASPNGQYFYISSFRSDVHCQCTTQTLDIFETRKVRTWLQKNELTQHIKPLHSIEMGGIKNPTSMREIKWSIDGEALNFIGKDADEVDQVYHFDLHSGELTALTNDPYRKYSSFVEGDTVFYRQWVPISMPLEESERIMIPVSRNEVGEIVIPWSSPTSARLEWVSSFRGGDFWTLPIAQFVQSGFGVPSLQAWFSPSGTHAILALQDITEKPQRFVLADFRRRKVQLLSEVSEEGRSVSHLRAMNLPTATQVLWTKDGEKAILVNTALPPDQKESSNYVQDEGYIVAYHVESDRWQVLEKMKQLGAVERQVSTIGWLESGEELLVTHLADGQPENGTVYRWRSDRWVAHDVPASVILPAQRDSGFPEGFTVRLRQSANDPPEIVVTERGRERVLSSPDPALEGVDWVRQEEFTWTTSDGESVTGGLTIPQSADLEAPYPLIVQASGTYHPDLFLPDGRVPSGFANQALVAEGMVVLELPSFGMSSQGTLRERPDFLARVDSAVMALSEKGIVDPTRVGLIGHSRTGHHVQYAISHPERIKYAAAEVWDSWTAIYPDYLFAAVTDFGLYPSDFHNSNGGPSFWKNKEAWLENEILFNIDRVESPTLIVQNGPNGTTKFGGLTIPSIMTLGAYQLNRRPVEFLSVPTGGHIYTRVPQRKSAMDMTVDWMRFWLLGKEDSKPQKIEQYARWRKIRDEWEIQQAWEAAGNPVGSVPDPDFRAN